MCHLCGGMSAGVVAITFWMSVCRVPMSMNQTHDSSVSICVFQELMSADVMNVFRKYVYNAYNDHFQCIQLYTDMRARCSRTHERHLQRQSCAAAEDVVQLANALSDAS